MMEFGAKIRKILLPISWLFGLVVFIRNKLYDAGILVQHRLPGTVVSIGNIAVGGTGKSPLVMDFARRITIAGGSPAIVSRGYRSGLASGQFQVLMDGRVVLGINRADVVADEARMQSLALPGVPVIVGSRRFEAIGSFLAAGPLKAITHWILDDGFQHRAISRDRDIVVMDARLVCGDLLPAGLFREPIVSLKRAHAVVITKASSEDEIARAKSKIRAVVPDCELYVATFTPEPPRQMAGPPLSPSPRWALVTGIARPDDFKRSLGKLGIHVIDDFIYPDHESFDAKAVLSRASEFDGLMTTEKDWARDEAKFLSLNIPVFVLPQVVDWLDGAAPGVANASKE